MDRAGQRGTEAIRPQQPPQKKILGQPAPQIAACTTVMDRGIAMIPLPTWGCTEDWQMIKILLLILVPLPQRRGEPPVTLILLDLHGRLHD